MSKPDCSKKTRGARVVRETVMSSGTGENTYRIAHWKLVVSWAILFAFAQTSTQNVYLIKLPVLTSSAPPSHPELRVVQPSAA